MLVGTLRMFDSSELDEILRLCVSGLGALKSLVVEAAYVVDAGRIAAVDIGRIEPAGVHEQIEAVGPRGGPITIDGRPSAWVVPLTGSSLCRGYLALSAPKELQGYECLLLDLIARQTSAALENAGLYRDVARYSASFRVLSKQNEAVTEQLRASVEGFERRNSVHEMLMQAATEPDVTAALAATLHELTGLTAAVEDRFGNVQVLVGPDDVEQYERLSEISHAEVCRAAVARPGRPVRVKGRLMALARPGSETLGSLVLVDPRRLAGDFEAFVLERASVVLGMELAHRRSLVEMELRLRRDLVDDLVAGTAEDDNMVVRAAAVGHDMTLPHRAVLVRWSGLAEDDLLLLACERTTRRLELPALVARHAGCALLLVGGDLPGEQFYELMCAELHSDTGAVGVGGLAETISGIPRSFDEAQHALAIRRKAQAPHGVIAFDDLGIYRILAVGDEADELQRYVTHWLGRLIEYDRTKHSTLVATLAEYLDQGGSYDLTADALVIHRSTLRYRLRRIRELSGLDLGEVESRLNLHIATRAWRITSSA
jgi:sugar diacid utilization regulator